MSRPVPDHSTLVSLTRQLRGQYGLDMQTAISKFLRSNPSPAELQLAQDFHVAASQLAACITFRAMRKEDTDPQHCVRCHDTFAEETNIINCCTIPHMYDSESAEGTGRGMYSYSAVCCDDAPELEEEASGGGGMFDMRGLDGEFCFVGEHTTSVAEAMGEPGYNGKNFTQCSKDANDMCTRTRLEQRDNWPLFG